MTSSLPTRNCPEWPGDLVLALGEREPGQPAHVLGPHAEVGVDARAGEPLAEPPDAAPAGGARSASVQRRRVAASGGGAKSRRLRQPRRPRRPDGHQFLPYLATFASCSACVFANALESDPSPFAMKNR